MVRRPRRASKGKRGGAHRQKKSQSGDARRTPNGGRLRLFLPARALSRKEKSVRRLFGVRRASPLWLFAFRIRGGKVEEKQNRRRIVALRSRSDPPPPTAVAPAGGPVHPGPCGPPPPGVIVTRNVADPTRECLPDGP